MWAWLLENETRHQLAVRDLRIAELEASVATLKLQLELAQLEAEEMAEINEHLRSEIRAGMAMALHLGRAHGMPVEGVK